MKKSLILYFFLLVSFISEAQQLSPNAQVSLLTIAPGSELYSTFGHSAIRINDPMTGTDINFNYGTFNFRTEGFYIKFLRGQLPYQISAHNFNEEVYYWSYENRQVIEQVLNLSQQQKQAIFDFLQTNYLPQNREYKYKFFYDNCSTRLRDVVAKACGDSLKFDKSLHADSSYRQWIDKYAMMNKKSWADFGMDIAIGEPADEITGWSGAMFLPDNLMFAFDNAQIMRNGKWESLVKQKQVIAPVNRVIEDESISSQTFFWLLFALVALLTAYQIFKTNNSLIFDKILFSITGFAGWILFLLWFFTDHGVTTNNLNIIWTYPLLFPIALFLKKKNSLQWLSKHFLAYGIVLILFLFVMNFLPQSINPTAIPIVLILATRAIFVWWRLRRKLTSF